jgi:long-chain acyl-CoA synthetase
MIMPENGALKIIDRRKNIFKLSIGEYIAPDKLEQVYKTVRCVDDIFVHGDSLKSCLVAIVFSEKNGLVKLAQELEIPGGYEELCINPQINKWFLDNLLLKQKETGLKGFEKIKRVMLNPKSFEELGLLTTTFKLKRHLAKKHFESEIAVLYDGLD